MAQPDGRGGSKVSSCSVIPEAGASRTLQPPDMCSSTKQFHMDPNTLCTILATQPSRSVYLSHPGSSVPRFINAHVENGCQCQHARYVNIIVESEMRSCSLVNLLLPLPPTTCHMGRRIIHHQQPALRSQHNGNASKLFNPAPAPRSSSQRYRSSVSAAALEQRPFKLTCAEQLQPHWLLGKLRDAVGLFATGRWQFDKSLPRTITTKLPLERNTQPCVAGRVGAVVAVGSVQQISSPLNRELSQHSLELEHGDLLNR
ncbi:unnamed protein product [Pleuronectes platessa]|uniref:Uncharacterized protein n=1 Tax=Pleuronectes platessa TaxID=8262 RepID=A0A9N7TT72_PLEPL|nr:unnamed protein product [Pleuronectes platessa]